MLWSFSFDGLTDRDGNIVFCTAHTFSHGILEVVNNEDHVYYYSLKSIPKELEEAGRKAVSAFKVQERFFHIEFFFKTEYQRWYSPHMGRDMELKVYGHWGVPFLVFPCSMGRFYDWKFFSTGCLFFSGIHL